MINKGQQILSSFTDRDVAVQANLREISWLNEELKCAKDRKELSTVELGELQMRQQLLVISIDKLKNEVMEGM